MRTTYKGKTGCGPWQIRDFPHSLRNLLKAKAVAEGRKLPVVIEEAVRMYLGIPPNSN
jgi:hypothetical protein